MKDLPFKYEIAYKPLEENGKLVFVGDRSKSKLIDKINAYIYLRLIMTYS